MMDTTYDVDDVLDALRKAVELRGADFVYPTQDCQYLVDGAPSCIAAVAMSVLDPDLLRQEAVERNDTAETLEGFTEEAGYVLRTAQEWQDGTFRADRDDPDYYAVPTRRRKPWGVALKKAREYAAEML